ncbi:MAG: AAA family ATPase [Candidatus Hydrogenedentes bacterium]|nr:AAA family ATPase [Candidatus Hydrogenedentota bacterium]
MTHTNGPALRIQRLTIRNYKGIEHLELEFPEPRMPGDPDVFVLGSENGLGKTSVLECCGLLLIAATTGESELELADPWYSTAFMPAVVIRAGTEFAEIKGKLTIAGEAAYVAIQIHPYGSLRIVNHSKRREILDGKLAWTHSRYFEDSLRAIWGLYPDPLLESAFISFNSYRKVHEGNPALGLIADGAGHRSRQLASPDEFSTSALKIQILRSMMRRAELFEREADYQATQDDSIDKLNSLMATYAGGTISRLRPSPDNTVEFRVDPIDGGPPYIFDGLSSGQKEIISTLFLIWYHTRNSPLVVLIDEPELHLNAQWHRSFVKTLFSIAPRNQYIMATHSEFVMDSVDADRRILLSATPEAVG